MVHLQETLPLKAIEELHGNTFEGDRQVEEPNYSEMLSYLKQQIDKA
jgi:hypothetical protein